MNISGICEHCSILKIVREIYFLNLHENIYVGFSVLTATLPNDKIYRLQQTTSIWLAGSLTGRPNILGEGQTSVGESSFCGRYKRCIAVRVGIRRSRGEYGFPLGPLPTHEIN